MANVTLQTQSIDDIVSFLNDVRDTGFIDQSVFESIGDQLRIQTEKRFKNQVDPDGNSWAPLEEKYAKRKAKKATRQKILQFEGRLFDTLVSQATDYSVKFGSNSIYANTHQFGSEDGDIPARPFLGINDEDKQIIADELQDAWENWLAQRA